MTAALIGLLVLSAAVWIGGLVTLIVVNRAAGRTLDESSRIELFRAIGRGYLPVGGSALAVLLACLAALFATREWDTATSLVVALGAALALALMFGVRQARGMATLRRQALSAQESTVLTEQIRTGARRAFLLRTSIVLLSLALYVVVVAAFAA